MIRLLMLLAWAPAQAGAFSLVFPLECILGKNCHIQQYMDRDPGPGHTDFTCGTLSYDGHSGTDFALSTLSAMQKGVPVLAAASGVVKGVRDDMPDISIRDPAAPALQDRDCGNGLVIDHGSGWETQYCHMAKGSVQVKPDQIVTAGQPLGLVGLSGNTEFPHLHLSLRRNGQPIDPFDPDGSATCGPGPLSALWAGDIPYAPGGILGIGLADAVPEYEALKAGLPLRPVTSRSPAMVIWAHYFGAQAGDVMTLSITGPDGGTIIVQEITLERTQAQGFRAIGKRLRGADWPVGNYSLRVIWTRQGTEIERSETNHPLR
ncbi:MAG: M23 family metallopeptidase [Pseudotabrizicola sp.]|uniref:M23 family metallopeptidase n=1 Tax=Pseudotabrizicola sp. TaxID=2939647 RepID=UPI0027302D6A|nr:M23 family metallopeptidase [Pseudotabrizicola sp.]MDZ7575562.1 M23 family metallopeptidase [Pseudotabrizicola sp.]